MLHTTYWIILHKNVSYKPMMYPGTEERERKKVPNPNGPNWIILLTLWHNIPFIFPIWNHVFFESLKPFIAWRCTELSLLIFYSETYYGQLGCMEWGGQKLFIITVQCMYEPCVYMDMYIHVQLSVLDMKVFLVRELSAKKRRRRAFWL